MFNPRSIVVIAAVGILAAHCSDKAPSAPGSLSWSSWSADRHLQAISYAEAELQFEQLPVKGAVSSYESFQLGGTGNRDTSAYLKKTFDSHGNLTSQMSYVFGSGFPTPVTYFTSYAYNSDGSIASLDRWQFIDNSVNYTTPVTNYYPSEAFEYDGFQNVTMYSIIDNGVAAGHHVYYYKNNGGIWRVDSTDTCVYDGSGVLVSLHSSHARFTFNAAGLVVTDSEAFGSLVSNSAFLYDNAGNLTDYYARRPGTVWTQTNDDWHYTYQFDAHGNWIQSTVRKVNWDNDSATVDTLTDNTVTTYRNITY
jgi:hypothetical protein